MSRSTVRAACYVGRLGTLAVALGIGIAVLGGYGAAAVSSADSTPSKSSTTDPRPKRDTSGPSDAAASGAKPSNGAGPAKRDHPRHPRSADGSEHRFRTSRSVEGARKKSDRPGSPDAGTAETTPAAPASVDKAPSLVVVSTDVALAQAGNAPNSLTDSPTPRTPLSDVAEWAVAAYSRRELAPGNEDGVSVRQPAAMTAGATALQANSPSQTAVDSNEPAAAVQIPQTPTPGYDIPPDWEAAYTGQPSTAHQVLVTGLRIVNAVTDALGIPFSLVSPSFSIPFVNDGTPPTFLMPGTDVSQGQYVDVPSGATWDKWIITPEAPTGQRVIAIHGGGFTSEANIFTFLTYNELARATGATVVVPVYPVIGKGGTAATVVPTMADLIAAEVLTYGTTKVSVLGDSAGGNIALAALQLQAARISQGQADADSMPGGLVLLSPSLDNNDPFTEVPFDDPILDPQVSKENRVAWLDGLDPTDPLASPIFGSLKGLPPTTVYSSSLDLITFQTLRLQQKAADTADGDFTFVLRKGLVHDWVTFFFLPDAQAELPGIYQAPGVHPQAV